MIVVAIPYYEGRRFLASAIRSVLEDRSVEAYVVVVDDASDDSPVDILAAFSTERLSYHRNPERLGMIGNHNRCLDFNRGQYFKILSQDDELIPGALGHQAMLLREHKEAVIVGGPREIIRPDGRRLMTIDHGLHGLIDRASICRAMANAGTNVVGEPASVLIRSSILHKGIRFSDSVPWLLDVHMWLQLLRHGYALMTEQPAARFRLSSQSYSVGMGQQQVRVFSAFLDEMVAHGDIGPWRGRFGKVRCACNAVLRQGLYRFVGV